MARAVDPAAAVSEPHPPAAGRTARALAHNGAALTAALITVVFWASAFVGIRSAGRTFSPGPLTLGRLAVGAAVIGVLLLVRREGLPRRADLRAVLPALVLCSLLWFGAYMILLNAAERRIDAGTASMLVNIGPILIAILAGLWLREGFPPALFAGCAIAFAGVAVIAFASSEQGEANTVGVVLCVLAAVAYAPGVILQKSVLRRLSALQTVFFCCVIAALACVPFAPTLVSELRDAGASSILWMLYLGIFPTAIAFTTWAFALARTDAGRLGATTYLVPPVSILLAWVLLSETPPALAFAGGALCLLGVVVTRRG